MYFGKYIVLARSSLIIQNFIYTKNLNISIVLINKIAQIYYNIIVDCFFELKLDDF